MLKAVNHLLSTNTPQGLHNCLTTLHEGWIASPELGDLTRVERVNTHHRCMALIEFVHALMPKKERKK